MIRQEIDIDGYWHATVFYMPGREDMPEVIDAFQEVECPESDIMKIRNIFPLMMNKGVTFPNFGQRRSVTVMGRATSWEEFFNTVLHETGHIRDSIVYWYGVDGYGEPPAYLQGEIGRLMAPAIRRIACPCCGRDTDYWSNEI